jgi:hypothetical protein
MREVLIQAFDRLDQDSGRILLKGLDEKASTMRL